MPEVVSSTSVNNGRDLLVYNTSWVWADGISLERIERVREAEKYCTPEVNGKGTGEDSDGPVSERMKLVGRPLEAVLSGNTKAQKSMTWLPCGLTSLIRCPFLRAAYAPVRAGISVSGICVEVSMICCDSVDLTRSTYLSLTMGRRVEIKYHMFPWRESPTSTITCQCMHPRKWRITETLREDEGRGGLCDSPYN